MHLIRDRSRWGPPAPGRGTPAGPQPAHAGGVRQAVLSAVGRREGLTTQLRERSIGELHTLPPFRPPAIEHLPERAVLAALLELEALGQVRRNERVHRHDSTQYAVHWTAVVPDGAPGANARR